MAIYRQLAEQMIARRERSHYRIAAGYLDRARQTLEHHGRAGEWRTLITDVRATHTSLRALQRRAGHPRPAMNVGDGSLAHISSRIVTSPFRDPRPVVRSAQQWLGGKD